MLGARGEHSIRLETALRHQVVDQKAQGHLLQVLVGGLIVRRPLITVVVRLRSSRLRILAATREGVVTTPR